MSVLVIKNEHGATFSCESRHFWHLDESRDGAPFRVGDMVGWSFSDGGQDNGRYVVIEVQA